MNRREVLVGAAAVAAVAAVPAALIATAPKKFYWNVLGEPIDAAGYFTVTQHSVDVTPEIELALSEGRYDVVGCNRDTFIITERPVHEPQFV